MGSFGPALTLPVKASSPPFQPGGDFFWLCPARQAVQADVFEALPPEPTAQIWRPTAFRTFFEGPEGCRT
jgi:hypothetical protein